MHQVPGSHLAIDGDQRAAGRDVFERVLPDMIASLEQNRADAIERLVAMIRQSLVEPKPRRPTRPTRASKERRLAGKSRAAKTKKLRSRVRSDE